MKIEFLRALTRYLAVLFVVGLLITFSFKNVRSEVDMEDLMENIQESVRESVKQTVKQQTRQETTAVITESIVEPSVAATGIGVGSCASGAVTLSFSVFTDEGNVSDKLMASGAASGTVVNGTALTVCLAPGQNTTLTLTCTQGHTGYDSASEHCGISNIAATNGYISPTMDPIFLANTTQSFYVWRY